MRQWEHCVLVNNDETVVNLLGQKKQLVETLVTVLGSDRCLRFQSPAEAYYELGRNGWELVTITQGQSRTTIWECHYFKRPVVKVQQPQ